MTGITTHILDLSCGRPAAGVGVSLERESAGAWTPLATGTTDADGRLKSFAGVSGLERGVYRLRFETGAYFAGKGVACFHPRVEVAFKIEADGHYHVPLLISPFGYSTYRGS